MHSSGQTTPRMWGRLTDRDRETDMRTDTQTVRIDDRGKQENSEGGRCGEGKGGRNRLTSRQEGIQTEIGRGRQGE